MSSGIPGGLPPPIIEGPPNPPNVPAPTSPLDTILQSFIINSDGTVGFNVSILPGTVSERILITAFIELLDTKNRERKNQEFMNDQKDTAVRRLLGLDIIEIGKAFQIIVSKLIDIDLYSQIVHENQNESIPKVKQKTEKFIDDVYDSTYENKRQNLIDRRQAMIDNYNALGPAAQNVTDTQAALDVAIQEFGEAFAVLSFAIFNLAIAQSNYDANPTPANQAALNAAQTAKDAAQETYDGAVEGLTDAQDAFDDATDALQEANDEYDQSVEAYNNAVDDWNDNYREDKNEDTFKKIEPYNTAVNSYNADARYNNPLIEKINIGLEIVEPPVPLLTLQPELPLATEENFTLGVGNNFDGTGNPNTVVLPIFLPPEPSTGTYEAIEEISNDTKIGYITTLTQPLVDALNAFKNVINKLRADGDFNDALKSLGLKFLAAGQTKTPETIAQTSSATSGIGQAGNVGEKRGLSEGLSRTLVDLLNKEFGVPSGSILIDLISLFQSETFQRTGLLSASDANLLLGTEPNQESLDSSTIGVVVSTAFLDYIGRAINTGSIESNVVGAIDTAALTDPVIAALSAEEKAALVKLLTALVSLNLILVGLNALTSQLGIPGLIPQFAANLLGIAPEDAQTLLNRDLFLKDIDQIPAAQAFLKALLVDAIMSTLKITQEKAQEIVVAALDKALAQIKEQNARADEEHITRDIDTRNRLAVDLLRARIAEGLIAEGLLPSPTPPTPVTPTPITPTPITPTPVTPTPIIVTPTPITPTPVTPTLITPTPVTPTVTVTPVETLPTSADIRNANINRDIILDSLQESLIDSGFTLEQAIEARNVALENLTDDIRRNETLQATIRLDAIKSSVFDELVNNFDFTDNQARAIAVRLTLDIARLKGEDLADALTAALGSSLDEGRSREIAEVVTVKITETAPEINPLLQPNIVSGITPLEELGSRLKTRIVEALAPVIGAQQAELIANDLQYIVFDSVNSLYAIANSNMNEVEKRVAKDHANEVLRASLEFLDGSIGTQAYLNNFLDPAKNYILAYRRAPPTHGETPEIDIPI